MRLLYLEKKLVDKKKENPAKGEFIDLDKSDFKKVYAGKSFFCNSPSKTKLTIQVYRPPTRQEKV